MEKLKEIASVERETQAGILRGWIEKYKFNEGICSNPKENDLQSIV